MSQGRQKIEFEGLLQENVLGTFSVIRGFADLQDLAEVAVAVPLSDLTCIPRLTTPSRAAFHLS